MDYVLRQAAPEDAEAVVLMHTLAHEECYPHLLSPAFFAARRKAIPERVTRRRKHLDVPDPRVIAVDANNEMVGFADAGPGRDRDGPVPLELYSIYLLSRAQGTGLGAALLGAAIGESPAYLWVLEENLRAQAFYRRHGFQPDGKRGLLPPEWEALPELRMVRPGRDATSAEEAGDGRYL
ncbi:L-amino acid N-acyltransferase YncA [Arthrobacter sp. SLBN-100]|uniref:GNAT family N-acetyltransferase n=1 Tax=Arthrobacter sp. SLBN-100 TaxID=2768450 RepID=UPI0011537811|nr:GNAT family N-acetyltransferase [Arthrobacter sp. SLBN-100]TQJ69602.1 L-amino acid N-acyltransferase YncA [Arthrobacter sp. SLBN-100]